MTSETSEKHKWSTIDNIIVWTRTIGYIIDRIDAQINGLF